MKNLNNQIVCFDEQGHCETFEEGTNEAYSDAYSNEPRFSIDPDSICYGCIYYRLDDEDGIGCIAPQPCIEGSMNGYRMDG